MSKRNTFLFLFSILFISNGFSQAWTKKVNPNLLQDAQKGANVEFLVIMKEKADVSGAYLLKNKNDKARYVISKLEEVAKRTQRNVIATLEQYDAPYTSYHIANIVWSVGNIKLIEALTYIPEVELVSVNPQPNPVFLPDNGESFSGEEVTSREGLEIGVANVRADEVWALGFTGQNVVIAGADTGYKWDHEAIKETYRGWDGSVANHDYNWHDAIDADASLDCPGQSDTPCDGHDHGTHTMGTMTGNDVNPEGLSIGVAPDAKWIGCKNMFSAGVGVGGPGGADVINFNINGVGTGQLTTYFECMQWFLAPYPVGDDDTEKDPAMAPHVVNNSWACVEGCADELMESDLSAMREAVQNLKASGVVFVGSAGNDGSQCSTIAFPPATFEETFTIGALEQDNDRLTGFSSRGPVATDGTLQMKPNISAPGRSVYSSVSNGGYSRFSGTSMAGPHAAAVVALVISANPGLAGNVDEIETIIEQSVVPAFTNEGCGGDGTSQSPNNSFGFGKIDALTAVTNALSLPVHLKEFYGEWQKNHADLYWITSSEQDNAYFEVQRSIDLNNWETIGKVMAKSSSNADIQYNYKDYTAAKGVNYYRLNQVDNSGKNTLSKAIVIHALIDAGNVATLFPNPSNGQVQIQLVDNSILYNGNLQVLIFNSLGQLEQQSVIKNEIETLHLPAGMHYYQIVDNNKQLLQKGKLIVNK